MGEFDLQPGDLMLLYSDGITESGAYEGEEFGEERLAKILQGQQDEPLEKIQAEVLNAVQQWSGREPDDDMTMVLVRTCEREQS